MSVFLKRSLLLAALSLSSASAFAMHAAEKDHARASRHTSSAPILRPADEPSTSMAAAPTTRTTASSWKKDPRSRLVEIRDQLKPVLSSDFRHGGFPLITPCQALIHELWAHTHASGLKERMSLMDEAVATLTETLKSFPERLEDSNKDNPLWGKVNKAFATMRQIYPVAEWCIEKFDAGELQILGSSRREKPREIQASTSAAEKSSAKSRDTSKGEKAGTKSSASARLAELKKSLANYENADLSSTSRRERIMAHVKKAYHLLKTTSRTRAKLDEIYEARNIVLKQYEAVHAELKIAQAAQDSARVEALEREKSRLAQQREQFYRDAIKALTKK